MATRMADEELDSLERELSSDNEGAATPLAAEARRARASEKRLLEALKEIEKVADNCRCGFSPCGCGSRCWDMARGALLEAES